MLYLPEMKRVNDERAEELRNRCDPTPVPLESNDYIIVVYEIGKGKSYYSRDRYFMTDRSLVKGWKMGEVSEAYQVAEEVNNSVGHNMAVAVDIRGSAREKSNTRVS